MTAQAERVVVGWDPHVRAWSTEADRPGTTPVPELVVGHLHTSDSELNRAGDDWGHLVHHRPRGVLVATTPEQVAALVTWAHDQGITVAARGGAHSLFGQGQAAGGIVVDMTGLDRIDMDSDRNRMTVQAGAPWLDVVNRAVQSRKTPPVLTDYISTSVGGTLSAGGVGGATHRWGFQVDLVSALEVATPTYGLLWCTAHRNSELFDAARAGHGQVGVITRAELDLVPAPERVLWRRLSYGSLEAYLTDQRRLVRDKRFDYIEGQVQPQDDGGWRYMLEAVTYLPDGGSSRRDDGDPLVEDLSHEPGLSTSDVVDYIEFADRMGPAETVARDTGVWLWPHPGTTTFVPDEHIEDIVTRTISRASHGRTGVDVGAGGVILLYPVDPTVVRAPLMRLPEGRGPVWLFSLMRMAPPDELNMLDEWLGDNRRFLDDVRRVGGHAYHVNAVETTPDEWEAHYGADVWRFLCEQKAKYDPHHILAPGQGMFPRGSTTQR